MAAVCMLLISIFPRQIKYAMDFTYVRKSRALKPLEQDPKSSHPSVKKQIGVYSDLAREWMPLVLFRSQKLTADVVDDKLCGLYFTSGENR